MMKTASTGGLAIASGGLASVFAPGQIIYEVLSLIGSGFLDASRGAHLVNHYYLSKHYANGFKNYVLNSHGVIEFPNVKIFPGQVGGAAATDPIVKTLAGQDYSFNNMATDEQIQAVYSLSSLLLLANGLDIEMMKRNVAAFAYLKYLEKHSFELTRLRLSPSENRFTVTVPQGLLTDSAHGGNVSEISWSWAAKDSSAYYNLFTSPYNSAVYRESLFNGQIADIDLNLELVNELKKDIQLKVVLKYPDGFTRTAYSEIDRFPQHGTLQLSLQSGNTLFLYNDNTASVFMDGDPHEQAWLYWGNPSNPDSQQIKFVEISNTGLREYVFSFSFPNSQPVSDNQNLWIETDGHKSNVLVADIRDPNDVDGDGLWDIWETAYFGNLSYGKYDDPDNDGKSNFVEMEQNTHPLKTGVDEVTNNRIFESYRNAGGIWVSTFHPYGDIYANVHLKDGTLDLNGKTLTIHGNLLHSDGTLKVSGGRLIVYGDYRIQRKTTAQDGTVSYGYSNGYLEMLNDADHVSVHGDFFTDSSNSHSSRLTAGILEIKGNFTQKSSYSWGGHDNFYAGGTHRVVLSGNSLQTVSFQSANKNSSHFNILEITNTSADGVNFLTNAVIISELKATETPVIGSEKISLSGSALITQGNWHYDLTVNSSSGDWTLTQDQTVEKNLYVESAALDLNGKNLTVKGSLLHSDGTLKVSGGRLIVYGDYRIQRKTTAQDGTVSYGYSNGYLEMLNDADHVSVHGDFFTDSSNSHSSRLTAGILEIKGNFTQKSSYSWGGHDNFYAGGTHTVLLSGNKIQTVSFGNPHSGSSHFNILEITNTSADGVEFTTPVVVSILFNHNQHPFTLSDSSQSSFPDYDGDTYKDDIDRFPLDPKQWAGDKPVTGNVNDDLTLDLADAIIALQIITGIHHEVNIDADVNNDGKIGMEEAIYIIRNISDNR